ncbi:Cmgc/cdk/crk7 protein kinase, variant, partial [Globisporangium splendens]
MELPPSPGAASPMLPPPPSPSPPHPASPPVPVLPPPPGSPPPNVTTNPTRSGNSSSFSSPLPPCPEDPPAPPPPSCTPPKYQPLEENDNTEDEERDDVDSVEDATLERQTDVFPTPPPPPSPPSASPMTLMLGTPPPPPPPPYSPPSIKIHLDTIGSPGKKSGSSTRRSVEYVGSENGGDGDQASDTSSQDAGRHERNGDGNYKDSAEGVTGDMRDDAKEKEGERDGGHRTLSIVEGSVSSASVRSPRGGPNAIAIRSTSSSVIASMRSAASEREILAVDFVRDVPIEKPRFYVGDIESYSIIDKVGSGTYGVSKDIVALKKLRPDVEKNGFPVTSIREIKILKFLKHPNILALKEIVSSSAPPKEGKRPPLYFAFEYMEHDLCGLLNHPRVKFTRTQIQCYMRQLLCGVAFMHRNKIIHRDIKASNLLLNNSGMLKVADFGLSRFWNEVNAKAGRYTNKVVTLWYRPPELLMGSTSYDFSVDIWSVGCIFAELLVGKPILQGKTEIEQLQLIFGLCGMPTEETWPGFFKLQGATTFEMDEKYVCRLRDRFKRIGKCGQEIVAIVLIVASIIAAINLQSATVITTAINIIQRHCTIIKAVIHGSFVTATATITIEIEIVTANEVEAAAAIESANATDRERVDIQQVEAVARVVATRRAAVRSRVDPIIAVRNSLVLQPKCSHLLKRCLTFRILQQNDRNGALSRARNASQRAACRRRALCDERSQRPVLLRPQRGIDVGDVDDEWRPLGVHYDGHELARVPGLSQEEPHGRPASRDLKAARPRRRDPANAGLRQRKERAAAEGDRKQQQQDHVGLGHSGASVWRYCGSLCCAD